MSNYPLAERDEIYELQPRTRQSILPNSATAMEKRIGTRTASNQSALDAKTQETIRAIRNDAVVCGVGADAQRRLVNHVFDIRDEQTREDDRREAEMAADLWIKRHNKAAQAIHNRFQREQQEILDRELIVPDTRPWYEKVLFELEE